MTVLYKPVRIESAEQAEALPRGTVAIRHDGDWHDAAVKLYDNAWQEASAEDWATSNGEMVGWTALVPVEAKEETRDHPGVMLPTNPPRYPQQTRLVTPWEVLADRP